MSKMQTFWRSQRPPPFRKYQPFSKNQPQKFEYYGFGQASYNEIKSCENLGAGPTSRREPSAPPHRKVIILGADA
jgi:hypothetical protein